MNRREHHRKWREANRDHVNAYSRDYAQSNVEQRAETTKRYRQRAKQDRLGMIKQLVKTSRLGAMKRGHECHLTVELIDAWLKVQGEKCALTDIPFVYTTDPDFRSRPFAPSIDRRDNTRGYTLDNIQIVCCMINRAKNEYTQEMLDLICIARVKKINGQA